jgi:hypothetical protein
MHCPDSAEPEPRPSLECGTQPAGIRVNRHGRDGGMREDCYVFGATVNVRSSPLFQAIPTVMTALIVTA